MKISVLKPGLLVSLKTSIQGGVYYQRSQIETEHKTDTGALVASWETTREIPDPADFEAATKARSKARAVITGVCAASSFGLLCPTAREGDLMQALEEARRIAEAHNAQAKRAMLYVYVLIGRVAQDDVEAMRAIGAEIRELLGAMQAGIQAANPEAIRDAANKARALGSMLNENVSGQVNEAIAQARKAAREIVKRVEKAGERAADVVKELVDDKIEKARFAFLDLEPEQSVSHEAPAARPVELPPENVSEVIPLRALPAQQLPLEV